MNEENQIAVTEPLREKVILWQDHAWKEGYRPALTLLTFPDGKRRRA